jgi:hypothetical protein
MSKRLRFRGRGLNFSPNKPNKNEDLLRIVEDTKFHRLKLSQPSVPANRVINDYVDAAISG